MSSDVALMKCLEAEKEKISTVMDYIQNNVGKYPDGKLYVSISKGNEQYYYLDSKKDESGKKKTNGKYIRKGSDLPKKIAQRDYEQAMYKILKKRDRAIQSVLNIYRNTDPTAPLKKMHAARIKLITPLFSTDEEYAENWQNQVYRGKQLGENVPEIYTAKGERVRSKSEKILADLFERNKIPYRYEYPLELQNGNVIYPDFMLLNKSTRKEYYLEHLGMMDDPQYAENAVKRIALYERNDMYPGEKLLITSETRSTPLNTALVTQLIHHYLL